LIFHREHASYVSPQVEGHLWTPAVGKLDDITRLRIHRADDQDVLDLIRAFMSMPVTHVLIGVDIPGSGLLREGRHDLRTGQYVFPPSAYAQRVKVNGREAGHLCKAIAVLQNHRVAQAA
jgi:hypothetical protein